MRYHEIICEAEPPQPPVPPQAKPPRNQLRDVEIPVPAGVFTRLGIPQGKVFADCAFLAGKHEEYFNTPEEVRLHVEEVLQRPDHIFPANRDDHRMLVRTNGEHRAVALEIVFKGGKYRVRSAYVLTDGQFQTLFNNQQSGK